MDKKPEPVKVDWATLRNLQGFEGHYDKKTDILLLQSKENRYAVSVDCDGEYWVRVDPKNGEVLGIEIEDFKKVFLKKYAKRIHKNDGDVYIRSVANIIQGDRGIKAYA